MPSKNLYGSARKIIEFLIPIEKYISVKKANCSLIFQCSFKSLTWMQYFPRLLTRMWNSIYSTCFPLHTSFRMEVPGRPNPNPISYPSFGCLSPFRECISRSHVLTFSRSHVSYSLTISYFYSDVYFNLAQTLSPLPDSPMHQQLHL